MTGLGCGRLEIVGLQVINGQLELRGGAGVTFRLRNAAVEKLGDIRTHRFRGPPADANSGSLAVLHRLVVPRAQQVDFLKEFRCQFRCVALVKVRYRDTHRTYHARETFYQRCVFWEIRENRPAGCLKEFKRSCEHARLETRIIRRSKGTPQFKGNPQSPRWLYLLGVLTNQADLRCGHSLFFDVVPKPAYGARAVRSNRDQQHTSNTVLLKEVRESAGVRLH